MTTEMIILIVVASVLFVALVLVSGALYMTGKVLKKMRSGEIKTDKVKVVDGVRYTKDGIVEKNGEINVSHQEGDVTLLRGEEYVVEKDGAVMPGKYTILTADGDTEVFNIRIGGFVREFTHNTPVVLAEGDKVCAVSHTVVLR